MPGLHSWVEMVLILWILIIFWLGLGCLGVMGEPRGTVDGQDIWDNKVSMGKIVSTVQQIRSQV